MKGRRVPGLDPDGSLVDNAERIVAVRLDELCAFMPQAADEREVTALHDMRIAAKRLRYVLEVTRHCFGPYAKTAAKRAKELQALLGEIHDCDEHRPAVEALIDALRAEDADAVCRAAGAASDVDVALTAAAPHAEAYDGLIGLATYLTARRRLLFARFLERWTELEREGFRARLTYAIAERPDPDPDPGPGPVLPPAAVASRPSGGLRPSRPLPPLRPAAGRPADQAVSSSFTHEPDERP